MNTATAPRIIVSFALYNAALLFAATDDVRYYLNGIGISRGKAGALLVATDGHRMLAVSDKSGVVEDAAPNVEVIVPRLKLPPNKKAHDIVFNGETATVRDAHELILYTVPATYIDGKFPDWRAAFPKGAESTEFPYINPRLLGGTKEVVAALHKAETGLSGKYDGGIRIHSFGPRFATVIDFGNVPGLMIVMPVRIDAYKLDGLPDWAQAL